MGSASVVLSLVAVMTLPPAIGEDAAAHAALIFTAVETKSGPKAKALLNESLSRFVGSRMKIIPCKGANRDENTLIKVFRELDIHHKRDLPERKRLLQKLMKSSCKLQGGAAPWVAWLTAYEDTQSKRREVTLRMRNLSDAQPMLHVASYAEQPGTQQAWSEMVDKCVRRYFDEDVPAPRPDPPRLGRPTQPIAIGIGAGEAAQIRDGKFFGCVSSELCDRFRDAEMELARCRRSHGGAGCVDPEATLEQWNVERIQGQWQASPPSVRLDLPGEYVFIGSTPGGAITSAQRLSVEPWSNAVRFFLGPSYQPLDVVALVSYHRFLVSSELGQVGVGLEWGDHLGSELGSGGVAGPSILAVLHLYGQLSFEATVALGVWYDHHGRTSLGETLRLAGLWRPQRSSRFSIQVALIGMLAQGYSLPFGIYFPMLGTGLDF